MGKKKTEYYIYRDTNYYSYENKNDVPQTIRFNNFETKRVYSSNLVFTEYGLFNSDTTVGYKFKVFKGMWYINQKGKWICFFDGKKVLQNALFTIGGNKYTFAYRNKAKINKNKVIVMELKPIYVVNSINPLYYFNPVCGFVAYQVNGILYAREPI